MKLVEVVSPLIDKLIVFVKHGDYTNGIEYMGIDKGRIGAREYLGEIEEDWEDLKKEVGL